MTLLQSLADNTNQDSLAVKLRKKRFGVFRALMQQLPKPITILDVGGTQQFWESVDCTDPSSVAVTLVNVVDCPATRENFSTTIGDARLMRQFNDGQFDVVFSNSVIEHVGTWEDQCSMAKEVVRIGKHYVVQTPNYYFPIEPHFLVPGFQFLPFRLRVFLLQHFNLGWVKKVPERLQAEAVVREVRLLTKREMQLLFPGGKISEEKFCGMTKSFTAYGGW